MDKHEMFKQELAQKPFVLCRWPARTEAQHDIAAKLLQSLSAVAASLQTDTLDWSADVGEENDFTMMPFPANVRPDDVDLASFSKTDDAGQIWQKGGLAIPLYGRISTWPKEDMVAFTGTVGAATRRGNSLKVDFLTEDIELIPPMKQISALVEALGEIWDADWCAALTHEIVEAVDWPIGAPKIGLVTYWSDRLGRELPAEDGVILQKTAKGRLADVSHLDIDSAIEYVRKA
ncbi:hypothetical protein ACFVTE_14060 [Arthrobacter sp. NPDC058097]|uniref:hypothetical protein n=1 Tax=Arthrobacter sp. NPDC058097 TaxID=3346340 RepID=UPI0036DEC584